MIVAARRAAGLYTRLSPRVKTIFQQYRYDVDNFHRRNRVYRAISGLLTYGLRRGPPGTYYIDDQDLLDIVRDTYPSSEDNWMFTNQDNRPTKEHRQQIIKARPAYGDGTKTTNSNDTWHATKAFSRKFKKLASEPKKNHGVTWHGQLQDEGSPGKRLDKQKQEHLLSNSNGSPGLGRYEKGIDRYDVTFEHKTDSQNGNVDALSRPWDSEGE
ncbi:hypothetical protein Bbelb_334250 [Branchiostoma belcheri]|nr:hypothetical protein Bbelb_334250 [Branchiostoma belcheri]